MFYYNCRKKQLKLIDMKLRLVSLMQKWKKYSDNFDISRQP